MNDQAVVLGVGMVPFAKYPDKTITDIGWPAVKAAIRAMLRTHPAVASTLPALATDAATLVLLKPPPSRS